jgi:hypothetical protein
MDLDEETIDEVLTPTDRRSRVADILIAGILRMHGAPPAIRENLLMDSKSGLELVSESLLSVSDVGVTRGDTDSQLSQMRQQAKRIQR